MPATTQRSEKYELAPSSYESVASLLIALLVLVGAIVALLAAIWWTSRVFPPTVPAPVELEEIGDDGGLGDNMELDPDVTEPGMDMEFEEPELAETLDTVTDAFSTRTAAFEDPVIWDAERTGRSGVTGDGRAPGNGTGKPGVKRHWEVQFGEGNTLATYAEQLDYFKIELGVLQRGGKVAYAANFAGGNPRKRTGNAADEERYYLTWRNGALKQADEQLLQLAGIPSTGRPILKFIPEDLERTLIGLERAAAGGEREKVRATYFSVREQGSGYEFYVSDQVLAP